jgi:phosphopantothenoylcysteine synthetase/decarboxylase
MQQGMISDPTLFDRKLPMRLLITAGPTREAIDPVRYLSNRSSGKMGYALAAAAAARGHEVVLISGPVRLEVPAGVAETVAVESARDLFDAVRERIDDCDAAIFCAAVADYRPVAVSDQKIKKTGDRLTLELERTEDVLGSARPVFGFGGVLVGFAAETDGLVAHAREKLEKKGCDLLVANDVSRPGIGFDSDRNAVMLFFADGRQESLSERPKSEIGQIVVEIVESLVEGRRHHVRQS